MPSSTPRRDRMNGQLNAMRAQINDLKSLTAIMTGQMKGQEAWSFLMCVHERREPLTDEQIRKLGGIRRHPSLNR